MCRKEFILQLLRMLSIGLLVALTGYLLFRRDDGKNCNFECGHCSKSGSCNLEKSKKTN